MKWIDRIKPITARRMKHSFTVQSDWKSQKELSKADRKEWDKLFSYYCENQWANPYTISVCKSLEGAIKSIDKQAILNPKGHKFFKYRITERSTTEQYYEVIN